MDDPANKSPPPSKKSSTLGKHDRPETPHRGSPYLTRSRRNSVLTEENLKVHNNETSENTTVQQNETAGLRRSTRRSSLSNDNGSLTPTPAAKRSSRRSPSVTSGDDLNSTPKKKFYVAKENALIEEDETTEENKPQSTDAVANESKMEVDKENINTIVNGNASEETLNRKSQDSSDFNRTVVEKATTKPLTETVTVVSNELAKSNSEAVPIEVPAKSTESVDTNVSITQSNDPPSVLSLDQSLAVDSQTAVKINEQPQPDTTDSSNSLNVTVQESTSQTSTTAEGSLETTSASSESNDISMVELNDTVVETPPKTTNVISVPNTPNAPIVCDVIIVPDTPLQAQKSSITETVLQTKEPSTTDVPETPTVIPATVQSVQQADPLKTPVQAKPSVDAPVTRLSILKAQKGVSSTAQSVQQTDSPKTSVPTKTPDVSTPVTPLAVPKVVASTPSTPVPTKTPVTPVAIPKTPASKQVTTVPSPTTPAQTKKTPDVSTPVAIPQASKTLEDGLKTPNSILNVTESEEEALLRTPPTPKTQSKAVVTGTVSTDNNTPKLGVNSDKISPSQKGNLAEADKSIDKLEADKSNTESTTPNAKSAKSMNSTVHVVDSSDEESNSANESRNMFLDDEAMESNGEPSMDEEERKYLEENEIPVDGISIGSESDEAMSEEEESDDSFIVSDSSVQLLDGSGDDLDESGRTDTSVKKTKRGNKIVDTSDEESKEVSTKKRRPDSSLNRTAKYMRVDEEDEEEVEEVKLNDTNENDADDELANLDDKPKRTRSSKRLSGSAPVPKQATKRLSLHPNTKINTDHVSNVNKNDSIEVDDNSEEDLTQELANLDEEPKRTSRSKRLSEPFESFKQNLKRKSLHPNTKLSGVELIQKENQTTEESGPTTVDESGKASVDEELANLDSEPKITKNKKRLSESNSLSKRDMKRLSLHPNTKLSSLESKGDEQTQQPQKSIVEESDAPGVIVVQDDSKDVKGEIVNIDDEPKIVETSKKLSPSKKAKEPFVIFPDIKLRRPGFDFKVYASAVFEDKSTVPPKTNANGQSAPSAGEHKTETERSFDAIQAKCDEMLQSANEARRLEKLNKQPMQDDKYQRLKEKKAAKLQEKKDKEARELEREAQAAKQRQLKRDKKTKIAELTEQEKIQAIQKALDFSEIINAKKVQHSNVARAEPLSESTEDEPATSTVKTTKRKHVARAEPLSESTEDEPAPSTVKTTKRKRKPKKLQILNAEPIEGTKKRRVEDTERVSAKPEGFKSSSIPVKRRQHENKKPKLMKTTAGPFEIDPMPENSNAGPFVVTTLQHNPATKFSSLKDKAILNSNVQRVSSAELLNRKSKQKKISKN